MNAMRGYSKYKEELRAQHSDWLKNVESFLIGNWWVVVATLVILLTYEQGKRLVQENELYLRERLHELQIEKETLTKENIRLQQMIQSQSDPRWIELTLMRRLGVVPDGMKKVYFKK